MKEHKNLYQNLVSKVTFFVIEVNPSFGARKNLFQHLGEVETKIRLYFQVFVILQCYKLVAQFVTDHRH